MARTRDEALAVATAFLKQAVRKHRIRKAYLFGSHAWGRPSEHSDIDLAVVLETTPVWGGDEFGEDFQIFHEAQEFDASLEPICFWPEGIEEGRWQIFERIEKEGLEIPLDEPSKEETPARA
jgi:predicted nucleotidyltransferase